MSFLENSKKFLENYFTKYKPIGIYYPGEIDNLGDSKLLLERLLSEDGIQPGNKILLELAVSSVEELGFIIRYLRGIPGVNILDFSTEHSITGYNSDTFPKFYNTLEEILKPGNLGICRGSEFAILIDIDKFHDFWNGFLYDFCIPLKYVGYSPWFLEYYKQNTDL